MTQRPGFRHWEPPSPPSCGGPYSVPGAPAEQPEHKDKAFTPFPIRLERRLAGEDEEFNYLANKHLLRTYHVPGTVLDAYGT